MADTNIVTWQPKEAKAVSLAIKVIAGLFLAGIAAYLIKAFVPSYIDAVNLVQSLLASSVKMAITAGVLIGALILLNETFSSKGKINKLFARAYSSFINKLTFALIDWDPITPLTDQKAEMITQQHDFDEGRARFDGVIQSLDDSYAGALQQSQQAEKRAKAAKARIDAGEGGDFQVTFDEQSYAYGSYAEAAKTFALMRDRLVPVRNRLKELSDGTATLIRKLDIDIDVLQKQWAAQKQMASMDTAARKLLSGTEKKEFALAAQKVIQGKYAEQMGRLKNLAETAKPLIQSIDLDRGTFSQELLDKWNAETQASASVITPALTDQTGIGTVPATGSFAKSLLKR